MGASRVHGSVSSGGGSQRLLLAAAAAAGAFAGAAGATWLHHQRRRCRAEADGGGGGDDDDEDLRLREDDGSDVGSDVGADDDDIDDRIDTSGIVYLDYNGTTPVTARVRRAMAPFLRQHYGNPSSGHGLAAAPRRALATARRRVLTSLLGVEVDVDAAADAQERLLRSIVFTSCGTESDNLAIHLALQLEEARRQRATATDPRAKRKAKPLPPPHVVTSNVEHPAVEACLRALEAAGRLQVTYVPVQPDGRVRAADVVAAIRPDGTTVLVTLMLANNESGALQPVRAVAEHCRAQQPRILVHTDAAQAAGKVSVRLADLGRPHLVSLVGHKLGAPKGVACLYVETGVVPDDAALLPPHGVALVGGAQEFGLRAGTPNVPYIAGFGRAAADAARHLDVHAQELEALRARLRDRLVARLGPENVLAHGPTDAADRLPNTLSVGLRGVHSGRLLAAIGDRVAASAGATCHSAAGDYSAVLRAMQVPAEFARGTLRLSLGPGLTVAEVDRAADVIAEAAERQLSVGGGGACEPGPCSAPTG